jgi:hypothetical protein
VLSAAVRSFVARMWPRCGPSSHELGRRVPSLGSAGMLHGWRSRGLFRPTVVVRGGPPGTGATGTRWARLARTTLDQRGSNGHKLNRRVRPVLGDRLPRWQEPQARGSYWGEGLEPAVGLLQRRRLAPQRGLSWRFSMPVVTGRDWSQPFRSGAGPCWVRAVSGTGGLGGHDRHGRLPRSSPATRDRIGRPGQPGQSSPPEHRELGKRPRRCRSAGRR